MYQTGDRGKFSEKLTCFLLISIGSSPRLPSASSQHLRTLNSHRGPRKTYEILCSKLGFLSLVVMVLPSFNFLAS